jgi:murein DD-endopeptidase MepM/ murein hydrolase activator NlpD
MWKSLLDNPQAILLGVGGVSLSVLALLLSLIGWSNIFRAFETSAPSIEFTGAVEGLGQVPLTIEATIEDPGSGLSWFSAQIQQGDKVYDLARRERVNGAHKRQVRLTFSGRSSGLREGTASLVLVAADLSVFENRKSSQINFTVDYEKPSLEILYAQEKVLQGSTHLMFVKSSDNTGRIEVGLRIGEETFKAFPARWLDRAFDDNTLYVIPFTVPLGLVADEVSMQVYAEDAVGNGSSLPVEAEIVPRAPVAQELEITKSFLREDVRKVFAANESVVAGYLRTVGTEIKFEHSENTLKRDREYFSLVYEVLAPIQEQKIRAILESQRFDRLWFRPLQKQASSVISRYATLQNFLGEQGDFGSRLMTGYDLELSRGAEEVAAVSDGVVHFAGDCAHLKKCVIVDHGLGLASLYGSLETISVATGARVVVGQSLGTGALNSLGRNRHFYLEVRLQGVPVEVKEWWSPQWFASNITGTTNRVKKLLGIPVRVSFD